MPVQIEKRKPFIYLFLGVALASVLSFVYLNLCTANTSMISNYMGDLSYSDFRIEEIVLPDLHFFESSFQRIVEIIFTRA